jgi:hypothetical protein
MMRYPKMGFDEYSWKEEYYEQKYGSDLDEYSYYEDDYSYYEGEEPEDSDDSYDRWLWENNWSEPEAEPTPEELGLVLEDSDDSYDRWLWENNLSEPETELTPEEELELNRQFLSRLLLIS